jgi:hypothetical protein
LQVCIISNLPVVFTSFWNGILRYSVVFNAFFGGAGCYFLQMYLFHRMT